MNQIKNIVIASDYAFFEGGAANVALQTAIALANNTEIDVYCFVGCGAPCEELKSTRIKIVALNLPDILHNKNRMEAAYKGIYNTYVEKKMKELLCRLDPDVTVVHIHSWTKVLTSAVFRASEKMGVPVFLTVHDYFLSCPNGACYNFVSKSICTKKPLSPKCLLCNCDSRCYSQKIWRCIRQFVQNIVIRNNKNIHYIFISGFQREQLMSRLPPVQNEHMVKNPIATNNRKRVFAEKNNAFFYIGRLSPEKGPSLFCEAVTKANVEGVVIGEGEQYVILEKNYPHILFLGKLDKHQIEKKIENARALIFPSLWYEGSPLVVPEVQSFGIPCIVTNCSSAVDNIIQGKTGEIVSPVVDSIVKAIYKFSDFNYVKSLSEETYNSFDISRSDMNHYVKELIEIYESEMGR